LSLRAPDLGHGVLAAGRLSRFVIADVTNPKSTPLELQATVPEIMIPFLPIIEEGEKPFAMLEDLLIKYDWVFAPLYYSSLDALIGALDKKIIGPANDRFDELMVRRVRPQPAGDPDAQHPVGLDCGRLDRRSRVGVHRQYGAGTFCGRAVNRVRHLRAVSLMTEIRKRNRRELP
jgi:hypothetical protein